MVPQPCQYPSSGSQSPAWGDLKYLHEHSWAKEDRQGSVSVAVDKNKDLSLFIEIVKSGKEGIQSNHVVFLTSAKVNFHLLLLLIRLETTRAR